MNFKSSLPNGKLDAQQTMRVRAAASHRKIYVMLLLVSSLLLSPYVHHIWCSDHPLEQARCKHRLAMP